MTSLTRNRLWWLLLCVVFVACASSPPATPTKKKKKKKKKRSDEVALKQKKDADRNDDEDQPDRPKKKSKRDEAADEDDVTVVDDDGDSEPAAKKKQKKADKAAEAAAEKKRKKEEAEAAAAEKKRKKEQEAEAAAAEKKRKQEEEEAAAAAAAEEAAKKKKKKKAKQAEEDVEVVAEEPVEDEEPTPKKGKKTDKVAARSKKSKAKKAAEDTEVAADEPPPEAEEPTPVKKKADKKKPEQVAAIDMTGSTPTPTDEPTIDMEDESSGKSLDERVDDAPPERRAVAIPVPGVDDESEAEVTAEAAAPVGADPRVINERPLVLGNGKLAVHGGLRVGVLTVEPMGAPKYSKTSTGFAIGATYGVGDKTEIGLDYTLGVSPATAKGPFALHGAYRAIDGKLDLAVAAALAVDPTPLVDFTTMQETSNTFVSLQIGAWARYRLTRKASLFSGLPALPTSAVSLTKYALPLPPQPYQLAIGINNAGTSALDVPIGLGYQINPKLYAFGALDLAHIRIANTVNAFIFRDFIPVSLGAFYVLDKLDIGATLSNDFDKGFDLVHFDTFVRYSIK